MNASPDQSLAIVIPAYQEEEALPITLQEILDLFLSRFSHLQLEIIIVDDGSTDQTFEIAQKFASQYPQIQCIRFEENQGMGAALKAGYLSAKSDWITFVPSDGQIPADQLLILMDQASRFQHDLICTRYLNRKYTPYRWLLSRGLRWLSALILGSDIQSEGPYLIRKQLIEALPMLSKSFMLNLEIPIRAKRIGAQYSEVQISLRERVAGVSKATSQGRILKTFFDLWALRKKLDVED
jgi:dolichol-phosphate mannosyltransferase